MSSLPLSVVVATVDRPEGVRRCLDAILSGRLLPSEIIVVDQGGRPETEAIVAAAGGDGVPVRMVRDGRRGLSASRNAGLRAGTGEIVVVTDDDCRPDPGWLEAVATAFERFPETVAVTGRVLADGSPEEGLATSLRTASDPRAFSGPVEPWLVGTGANFAVRRRTALGFGGYDERLGTGSPGRAAEDMDLIHRLLSAGRTIRYEPAMLVFHARETPEHRRATRWGYGHGIGAMCALGSRRGDRRSPALLGRFALMRARRLRDAAAAGDPGAVRDELTMLSAIVAGVVYGLRAGRAS